MKKHFIALIFMGFLGVSAAFAGQKGNAKKEPKHSHSEKSHSHEKKKPDQHGHTKKHGHSHGHSHGHRAHVHGTGECEFVLDQGKIQLRLTVPAHDIVGFERKPRNEQQKKRIQDAIKKMENKALISILPEEAGCEVKKLQIQADQLKESHTGGHADFEAQYFIECKKVNAVDSIQFSGFFDEFKKIENFQCQGIGVDARQLSQKVTPKESRASLK